MGLAEVLTVVFVILKLTGVITWSWWLVFLPEVIALALYAAVITLQIVWFNKTSKNMRKDFKKWSW